MKRPIPCAFIKERLDNLIESAYIKHMGVKLYISQEIPVTVINTLTVSKENDHVVG